MSKKQSKVAKKSKRSLLYPTLAVEVNRAGPDSKVNSWRDDAWNEIFRLACRCGDRELWRTRDTLRALAKAMRAGGVK